MTLDDLTDRFLTGCLDPGKILCVRPSAGDREVDPVAERMRQDRASLTSLPVSIPA